MARELTAGSQIAGFRIEGVLGRGGMSVVYLAEQVNLGRKVALKLLAPALADDNAFRARFEREWRLAASIDDPNIIPIYDAGEADGHLYLSMRYVQGYDLRALLARAGPLDSGETLAILTQVASALDAAHARGLVHRDVKPGNVLIMSSGPRAAIGHVYLADFGLTKRSASQSGLTRLGQFVGTLDYVAPEQIEGRVLDGRTDLYALGCVLYECLTGEAPFPRDSDPAVLYAHLREALPSVESRRPDIPHGIDAVIATATAKAPDQRFESGAALIAALRTVFDSDGTQATPAPRSGSTIADPLRAGSAVHEEDERQSAAADRVRAFLAVALSRTPPSPLRDQLSEIATALDGRPRVVVVGLDHRLANDVAATLTAAVDELDFQLAAQGAWAPEFDNLIAGCVAHVAVFSMRSPGTPELTVLIDRLRQSGASPVRSLGILLPDPGDVHATPSREIMQASAEALQAEPAVRMTLGSVLALLDEDRTSTGNGAVIAPLSTIRTTIGKRADRLMADWSMTRLEAALRAVVGRDEDNALDLQDDLEALRLELFELDELHSLDDLLAGRLPVVDAQAGELERLFDGRQAAERLGLHQSASPKELQAAAQLGAERWRGFLDASRPSGPVRRAAEIAAGAYDRLWTVAGGAQQPS
jgi:serine/threonine protein kinase